jgi:uncharacterized membrane protein (DUF485 family)
MMSPVNQSSHDEPAAARRARAGLTLFFLYVLLYAGFMGLVLLRPEWLSWRPFGGVNLAIAYGLGLIAAALVLAAIYMAACRWADRRI